VQFSFHLAQGESDRFRPVLPRDGGAGAKCTDATVRFRYTLFDFATIRGVSRLASEETISG